VRSGELVRLAHAAAIAAALLWGPGAAASPGAQLFPSTLPGAAGPGEGLALPLPDGWSLQIMPLAGKTYSHATVAVPEKVCWNRIWFDYLPAVTLDQARKLVDTESLEVSAAIRPWVERTYVPMQLAGRPAVAVRFPEADHSDRTLYLVPGGGGVLAMQVMAVDRALACVGDHDAVAAKLAAAFQEPAVVAQAERLSATRPPPPVREVRPVPRNLEESIALLERMLRPEELEAFRSTKESELARYHFSLGLRIRNGWGLWGGSPLARWFTGKGIHHPDNMSSIILVQLWRHLNARPLGTGELLEEYRKGNEDPKTERPAERR
jgi:hypothetical protein